MASCHKCGKLKIRKNAAGHRYCTRCGCMPGQGQVNRSGASITLEELDELPKGTRVETIKTLVRVKQMSQRLDQEMAPKLELRK